MSMLFILLFFFGGKCYGWVEKIGNKVLYLFLLFIYFIVVLIVVMVIFFVFNVGV